MKSIIALTLVLLILSGCASMTPNVKPEVQVVKQTQYIVRIPPKELLTLPEQVPNINVDTAKQSDVAQWLIANEVRTKTLEDQLIGIGAFFSNQEAQLNAQADGQNTAAKDAGVAAFSGEAKAAENKTVDQSVADNLKALKK